MTGTHTADGPPFVRTDEANFAGLPDYPFAPHWHEHQGLRMHYVDEGPRDAPVALLTHGMPTWSFLNRHIVAALLAAGYRCVAPDHIGFGRSDKVTDDSWYSIERHIEAHRSLVERLDLRDVTLFCQDWGGPITLAHVAAAPDRYARLVIMNTWLHHDGYVYTDQLRTWNAQWKADGLFARSIPDPLGIGWFMMLPLGAMRPPDLFGIVQSRTFPTLSAEQDAVRRGYDAPFAGLGYAGLAGPRRFPLSLPFDNPQGGAAARQARTWDALQSWPKPAHFIWGGSDAVFTEAWGRQWAAAYPAATFDLLPDAGHFLQETHGRQIAEIFLARARQGLR
jgi:haloalkane dehalogenase